MWMNLETTVWIVVASFLAILVTQIAMDGISPRWPPRLAAAVAYAHIGSVICYLLSGVWLVVLILAG